MQTGNSIQGAHLVYMKAKQAMIDAGLSLEGAVLTQSYLRLEVPLVTGLNTFKFPVLTTDDYNGTPKRASEIRLKLQDALYVSTMQFYLYKAASLADMAIQLKTYPAPETFASFAALYTVYNGYLQVTVNGQKLITNYPMSDFLQIYQTQATAATNSPNDMFDGTEGVVFQPNPVFIGQKDNELSITLPAALTAQADSFVFMVIKLNGINAQNVTVVS